MARPGRPAGSTPPAARDRLHNAFLRADPLQRVFPGLAGLRVELEFEDVSRMAPSAQAHGYFPSARAFFRYRCPCHACDGEFDLTDRIEALVAEGDLGARSRQFSLSCTGQRRNEWNGTVPCTLRARVRVATVAGEPSPAVE